MTSCPRTTAAYPHTLSTITYGLTLEDKMPDKDPASDIPHQRKEPRPDFTKPLPNKPLPKSIQEKLDNDEKLWEALTSPACVFAASVRSVC